MPSKEQQLTWKGVAAGTSSALSMIGSMYILGRYWYARRMRAKASPVSTVHHVDVTKELIHVLAWLDLIGAVGRVFGVLPTQTFDQNAGEAVTNVCKLQAYVIMFGDVSPIAWNFLMALNLFRWVCMGEDQQMLQRKIRWYLLATLAFTLTIATLALVFNAYGDAGLWCWIAIPHDAGKEVSWKLGTLYVWVLLGALAMGILLILVKLDIRERLKGVDNDDARVAYQGVATNLSIYILSFIVCWSPAVVDRGYSAIMGHDVFVLSMLHASIVPLQGFVNAVIYGKFHVWIGRHIHQTRVNGKVLERESSPDTATDSECMTAMQERGRRHFGTASLFVTTFDMNWSPFPPNLEDWIPAGKDVYVFSLQHCIGVQQVEQAIRKHLIQVNYPMGYRSITSLAGTQFRGHTQDAAVCQIVFVNNADVASGNFEFHTGDGRIWSQRKNFKDVVGIPMRYFEASLAFVSCNLSNAAPHPNQVAHVGATTTLSSKHAATSSLIHSFGMDADRADVDFPYLYHHTFLSGNLNYDLDVPRVTLTQSIDQAYKAECLKRATDASVDMKLRNFGTGTRGRANGSIGLPSAIRSEPANSNVPVEWNLLYFKSRGSLGRASASSSASGEDDEDYYEVYTSSHDGLPFTLLQSPQRTFNDKSTSTASFVSVSSNESAETAGAQFNVQIEIPEGGVLDENDKQTNPDADPPQKAWFAFLDGLFPSVSPQRVVGGILTRSMSGSSKQGRSNSFSAVRGESKKISDWLLKSQLAAESSQRKWHELLHHDELRAAMESKEILCGFEEPPIAFLPSYPRRVGASASYSMLTEKSCKAVFADTSDDGVARTEQPAYKDRILSHSLPDARQRLRNVGYWLCEEILTSTHKPVCSLYELEIDRFFAFKNTQANQQDVKEGKFALRDKRDVHEFKIKLVNLDANIWTYQPIQRAATNPLWRIRSGGNPDSASSAFEHTSTASGSDHAPASSGSIVSVFGRKKRRERGDSRRSMHSSSSSGPPVSGGTTSSSVRRGRLDSLDSSQVELAPVDPTSISTVFPLPSEDVYALQRKVYEVAHSVQSGFQSSAKDGETEESLLAYTNFRTLAWKEAAQHGVMHTAITKAVNGVIHVAIKIQGDKGHGGQGILCIQERDLLNHAAPHIQDAEPIPFDLTLTWGGKHVGYLHGDILSGV